MRSFDPIQVENPWAVFGPRFRRRAGVIKNCTLIK